MLWLSRHSILNAGFGLPNATDPSFAHRIRPSSIACSRSNRFRTREILLPASAWPTHRIGAGSYSGTARPCFAPDTEFFMTDCLQISPTNTAESQPNTFGGGHSLPDRARHRQNASTFPGISPTAQLLRFSSNHGQQPAQSPDAAVERGRAAGIAAGTRSDAGVCGNKRRTSFRESGFQSGDWLDASITFT